MMDSDQNWSHCWHASVPTVEEFSHSTYGFGSTEAVLHFTDRLGVVDEEIFQSPTAPHSVSNYSDLQTLGGGSWQEHLLADPSASIQLDSVDYQHNVLNTLKSIANATPSANCESGDVGWSGSSHAPLESWKTFLESGDGDAETATEVAHLGMCSQETNHAARIAQRTLKPRRRKQSENNGVTSSGRRPREANWTLDESRLLLLHMEAQTTDGGRPRPRPPWPAISESLKAMGIAREPKACENRWGVLLADLTKFENHFGSDDILRDTHLWERVGTMSTEQRSGNKLPLVFEPEWFESISRIHDLRSRDRKSRRSYKGRVHAAALGAEPSSSSYSQKARVSATPSSEIFDNSVSDRGEISRLVGTLSSSERCVTDGQTLEAMRMQLKLKTLDLRRREIEFDLLSKQIELERIRTWNAHVSRLRELDSRKAPSPTTAEQRN